MIASLDHRVLTVRDLEATLRFYRDRLSIGYLGDIDAETQLSGI